MNKTYLKYLFKSKKNQCLAIVIFYALAAIISFTLNSADISNAEINLVMASVVLAFAATILVPITYSFVHNKKAVDTYFSLPITRKEMLFTSQLYIDLSVLVPFLVSAIASLIIGTDSIVNYGAYLLYLLVAVVSVIVFVAFETTIFTEANTVFDGVVLMLAYLIFPLFIALLLDTFTQDYITGVNPINVEQFISYISLPTATFGNEIYFTECFSGICKNCNLFTNEFVALIVSLILHIAVAIYGLRKNFIERKAERAETISDSFFSYPFIKYAYVFTIVTGISLTIVSTGKGQVQLGSEWMFVLFAVLILYLICNFVYRRKVKIYFKDILFFVLTVVISIGFSLVAYNTKGFGLSNVYDKNPNNLAFVYECWYDQNEIEEAIPNYDQKYDGAAGILVEGFIKESEMDSKKEIVDYINNLRNKAIESFYKQDGYAYLVIKTNYDPLDYGDVNTIYENSKYKAAYERCVEVPLKELLKYREDINIYVETFAETGDPIDVNVNELMD